MTVRIQRNTAAVWRAIKAFGTQERMAEELDVDQTTVSEWGKGGRPVPWAKCVRIELETRRIAAARRDPSLVVRCEELQPSSDWKDMLELARQRLAAGVA
jgi:DNA-binding transcriptional regulator YdaS (Cro superfamily)